MIKNRLLIVENMIPIGVMWRLGFLIILSLLLFPVNVIASENSPSANSTNSEQIIQEKKEESSSSVIHVNEGTIIYGMEFISQDQKPKDAEDIKNTRQIAKKKAKKHSVAEKDLRKIRSKRITKLPSTDIKISIHHSTDSFKLSKQQFASGTLTNILLKTAILTRVSNFQTAFSYNTNSSYIPYLLLKGGLADAVFFTRPPPFI